MKIQVNIFDPKGDFMTALRDLTGSRFTRWLVIERAENSHDRHARWLCVCSCADGTKRVVSATSLVQGVSESCGCLKIEKTRERLIGNTLGLRHGYGSPNPEKRTAIYRTWQSMIQRCTNPKATSYMRYGGGGVTVCDRWQDFENFLADMGDRPTGTTLGRFRDSGNYEPENCKWMTRAEQTAEARKKGTFDIGRRHHSEATRAKLSAIAKGRTPWNLGKPHSMETRARIGAAHRGNNHCTGRILSPETRRKIGLAQAAHQQRLMMAA
jgi:hypothetical protein